MSDIDRTSDTTDNENSDEDLSLSSSVDQDTDHDTDSSESLVVSSSSESDHQSHEGYALSQKVFVVSVILSMITTLVLSVFSVWLFVHFKGADIHKSPQPSGVDVSKFVLSDATIISSQQVDTVLKRNLFHQNASTEQPPEEDTPLSGQIRKTRLPLRLVGTVYGNDPYSGIAMIEDINSETVTSFVADSWIAKDVRIHQILRGRVILDHAGTLEVLEQKIKELERRRRGSASRSSISSVSAQISQASEGRLSEYKEEGYEFSAGQIKMTESYKNKLLNEDFTKVLQDMKADPFMEGKKLAGFKLSRIRKNSIYEKAGLADGDIVTEINGIELTSVSQAISVLQAARNSNRLEVTIIQGGQPQTVEITIGQ